MYDVATGDNFSLSLDESLGFKSAEQIICVDYMQEKGKFKIICSKIHILINCFIFVCMF